MSTAKVSALRVINNNSAIAAVLLVKTSGTEYPLSGDIHPGSSRIFHLNVVEGLNDGDTFHVRVRMTHSGETADSRVTLTYLDTAGSEGVYKIGGTAVAPSITYWGTEWAGNPGAPA